MSVQSIQEQAESSSSHGSTEHESSPSYLQRIFDYIFPPPDEASRSLIPPSGRSRLNRSQSAGPDISGSRTRPNPGSRSQVGYGSLESGQSSSLMRDQRSLSHSNLLLRFAGERPDGESDEEDESENSENNDTTDDRHDGPEHPLSNLEAGFMLTKSFVGTGVLFLPRAFMNGGLLFSSITLIVVSLLSLFCFILLLEARLEAGKNMSFAKLGKELYGPNFSKIINLSLVVSQIGFCSAYIVFTAENLRAVVMSLTMDRTNWPIWAFIFFQFLVILPVSFLRQINALKKPTFYANIFIAGSLFCVYYYDFLSLSQNGPGPNITMFNSDHWSLFVGTAIFTFEGIGLIIPVQSDMKEPERFPGLLKIVMAGITVLFVSVGAISYVAYGSNTETVLLLNLPKNNSVVTGVQLLYSVAILLSTPLQLFPAVKIVSRAIFRNSPSGKYNVGTKIKKNIFRSFAVAVVAGIAYVGAENLDRFVALVGSFACIPLVYIYPPMLHYRSGAAKGYFKDLDILMCLGGLIMMVYTTALTLSPRPSVADPHGP